MVRKAEHVKQGDLSVSKDGVHGLQGSEEPGPVGVRASIVAMKCRNGRGAKGCREVELWSS